MKISKIEEKSKLSNIEENSKFAKIEENVKFTKKSPWSIPVKNFLL
jgi:hypothetical protein